MFIPVARVVGIDRRETAVKVNLFYNNTTKEMYKDFVNNNYQGSVEDFIWLFCNITRRLQIYRGTVGVNSCSVVV